MTILFIVALNVEFKLSKSSLLVKSWTTNRTPQPSAPWTKQMAATFLHQIFANNRAVAATAVIVQFAAVLRPGERFATTWEDALFPGDFGIQTF